MKRRKLITIVVSGVVILWALSNTWGVAQLSTRSLNKLRPADNSSAVMVKGNRPWTAADLPKEWHSKTGLAILPCFVACDVAYAKDHFGDAVRTYHFWCLGFSIQLSSKHIWQKR